MPVVVMIGNASNYLRISVAGSRDICIGCHGGGLAKLGPLANRNAWGQTLFSTANLD